MSGVSHELMRRVWATPSPGDPFWLASVRAYVLELRAQVVDMPRRRRAYFGSEGFWVPDRTWWERNGWQRRLAWRAARLVMGG